MADYTQVEKVPDFKCEQCCNHLDMSGDDLAYDTHAKKSVLHKRTLIHTKPQVLVLHFRRQLFGANTLAKNYKLVDFPISDFDISPYCTEQLRHDGIKYRLRSVIVHSGNSSYGHFVTFRRTSCNASHSNWICANDRDTRECSEAVVKNQQAYILLYEQMPTAATCNTTPACTTAATAASSAEPDVY
jgi:ubiquitin C-terminal hydrolase